MDENFSTQSSLNGKCHPGFYGAKTSRPPGISVQEIRKIILLQIAGNPTESTFMEHVKSAIHYDLPIIPNTATKNDISFALWLSPNSWLIGFYQDTLVNVFNSQTLNLNNVSSGRTILRFSGLDTRDMLAKGCPIDLHPEIFTPGSCAQSKVGSLNILLNVVDRETIDLFVPRSFSVGFWEWVLEASAEYGLQVRPAL